MKHQQAWLPSGFPTLKKSHHFDFSLLLTRGCTGIKDPVSSLENNFVYCCEWYQFLQSQIIYLFFNARFLNHCLCKKFCHKFKHNVKFLSTKKFAAFLSVWLHRSFIFLRERESLNHKKSWQGKMYLWIGSLGDDLDQ